MADPVVGITNGVPTSGTGTITTLGQTLVDGANATHGAIADAAVAAGATGTFAAKLRAISRDIGALVTGTILAAGSAIIGKVGIDQTTDGTTNKVRAILHDGTTAAVVKPASTAPVATDPAIVVAISPNSINANINAVSGVTATAGAPTVNFDPYSQYETVAASATDQIMGATGAQYDYIAGILIIPGTAAAGAVSIKDGNGSAISVFAGGGTTALPSLVPFLVPLGLYALAATTPGWKITTGTNVTAIGVGKFT